MKINVGTNCGNLQRVDTKGIKRNDLTMRLVQTLCLDEINGGKHKDIKINTGNGLCIKGWAPARKMATKNVLCCSRCISYWDCPNCNAGNETHTDTEFPSGEKTKCSKCKQPVKLFEE